MSKMLFASLLLVLCARSTAADAVEFAAGSVDIGVQGYADLRGIITPDQGTWIDGELGKTRYGDASNPDFRLAEIVGQIRAQITGELSAAVVGRIESKQRTFVDILEAYIRYRPVSVSAWRWSVTAGAFFPPISLENTEIGWTSPWTLTPSAINSWVGEELRTIGAEGRVEWRSDARAIGAVGSIYGWNDPAGILIADRGWSLDDRPTGLIDHPRLPDAIAYARHIPEPYTTLEFIDIDSRPGWYAGASWDENGIGRIEVLRYNNEADPTAIRKQVAWRTDFWSAGARTNVGPVTLLAQGMRGETYIKPSPFFFSDTYFESAYVLAGYEMGDWRLAARAEIFSTDENHTGTSIRMSEHGNALTAAVSWLPYDWLRVTAEWLRVESTRPQRTTDDLDAHQVDTQVQLSAKFYLN